MAKSLSLGFLTAGTLIALAAFAVAIAGFFALGFRGSPGTVCVGNLECYNAYYSTLGAGEMYLLGAGIVSFVGFIVLLVGATIADSERRKLARSTPQQPSTSAPPTGSSYIPPAAPPQTAMTQQKFCPACGSRFPAEYNVCPKDTSGLKALQ